MSPTLAKSKPRPGRPRDPELPGRRCEQILRAATRLFAKRGFPNTDLDDVARALKIGKGTIYRYFPSKRELFQAAVDRAMFEMGAAIDSAAAGSDDPLEQIVQAIRGYLQFFHEHSEYVELLIQERAEFRDRKRPTYFEFREANAERWREVYRQLIRDKRIVDFPVDRIRDVLGDLIYGAMFTNHVAGRTRSLVEQADDIVEIVFYGLLTPAERATRRPLRSELAQ